MSLEAVFPHFETFSGCSALRDGPGRRQTCHFFQQLIDLGGVRRQVFYLPASVIALQNDLSFLLNTPTPAGLSINSVPGRADLLATIRISQVPLPAGAPLLLSGLGAFAMMRRRKT